MSRKIGAWVVALLMLGGWMARAQDNPVKREGKADKKKIQNTDNISTQTKDQIKQAILEATRAVGIEMSEQDADRQATEAKRTGTLALTFSEVKVAVKRGQPTTRTDTVNFTTIIGANAAPSTIDHENGHRAINQVIGDEPFLSDFAQVLLDNTALPDADLNELMNRKLRRMEDEIGEKGFDELIKRTSEEQRKKMNQQAVAETFASIVRDTFREIFKRCVADKRKEKQGAMLTKEEAQACIDRANLAALAVIVEMSVGVNKVEEVDKERKRDFNKFIEAILKKLPKEEKK